MASLSRRTTAKASDMTKQLQTHFISTLKSELSQSPLASNVVFGLILTGLEKFVEIDFACPCDPTLNALFGSAYIILPGVIFSVLMLVIHGCKCKVQQDLKKLLLSSPVPIIMWLILVFLDGQYYACARTNWSGRYVIVDKAEPQRWCEPANSTSSMQRMSLTQTWYFQSQGIGLAILSGCVFLFILYGAYKCLCKKPTDGKDQNEEGPNIPNTLELGARGAGQDSSKENESSGRH